MMRKLVFQKLTMYLLAFGIVTGSVASVAEDASPYDVDSADVQEIRQAYLGEATILLREPAENAAVQAVIPSGTPVLITAYSGDYVLVNVQINTPLQEAAYTISSEQDEEESDIEDFQVSEEAEASSIGSDTQSSLYEPILMDGYVPLASLAVAEKIRDASRVACAVETAVLYQEAHEYASTTTYLPAGSIVQVDGISTSFSRIKGLGAYVHTSALQRLDAREVKSVSGFWTTAMPLYGIKDGKPALLSVEVPPNTILDTEWSYGDWYCVLYDGTWGLIAQENMQKLKAQKLPEILAAILREGTPLRVEPIDDGTQSGITAQADTPLWISETVNDHAVVVENGEMFFVPMSDLHIIGEIAKVPKHEGYLEVAAPLIDFPDAQMGVQVGEAPANSLVTILAQNAQYAEVSLGGARKYIARADFIALDDLFLEPEKLENYYLLMNRAKRELTVYLADAEGNRTDTILWQEAVAIGRQTRPTPVGTFKLTDNRHRWRTFLPQFAPFAIQYTSGKRQLFIHGPMYTQPYESTLIEGALREFGLMRTSGCIRVPYDMMLWIYTHCGPDNSVLEVIGGRDTVG